MAVAEQMFAVMIKTQENEKEMKRITITFDVIYNRGKNVSFIETDRWFCLMTTNYCDFYGDNKNVMKSCRIEHRLNHKRLCRFDTVHFPLQTLSWKGLNNKNRTFAWCKIVLFVHGMCHLHACSKCFSPSRFYCIARIQFIYRQVQNSTTYYQLVPLLCHF